MIRIIAGKHKRQNLFVPKGRLVRPTSDRTRTALFNVLGSWIYDKNILELFAGSGCVGFECLSRGAKHVTFVEKSSVALKCIRQNAKQLNETEKIDIRVEDVFRFLENVEQAACLSEAGELKTEIEDQTTSTMLPLQRSLTRRMLGGNKIENSFDFIYADPPYRDSDIFMLLEKISLSKVANRDSIIVIEHEKRKEILEGEIYSGWECYKNARYGKAILSYFKEKLEI